MTMSFFWDSNSVATNIVVAIGLVFLCIYGYFKYCYTYWYRKKVPYLPPRFPLGNNLILGPDAVTYGNEAATWYRRFKKMGVRFGGAWNYCNPVLVLVDPELIKDVLVKDFNNFLDRDVFHNAKHDPKGYNLFFMRGEEWRYMRQKISPAFTSVKMRYMFECVKKCSEMLITLFDEAIETKEDIPIRLLIDRYTMNNIGVVAFGLQFNCQLAADNNFRKAADIFNYPDYKNKFVRVICRLAPDLGRKLGFSFFDREITTFFGSIVEENVAERLKSQQIRNDFTQLLLDIVKQSEKDNTRFDINDVIANCIVFFFAGFDTSSKTVQFTLVELAKNPALQDKTRDEINRILSKHNGQLTYESLQEMTYLKQVIDETLRMYPVVLTLSRICQNDYKLKGTETIVKAGTTILIPLMGLQRDPEIFPDPEKYDPDRFSAENKGNIAPCTYIPFGEGPRNCVGRRFGSMQSAIALVQILSNYKIELTSKVKFPLPIKEGQFLLETDELYIRAQKISH